MTRPQPLVRARRVPERSRPEDAEGFFEDAGLAAGDEAGSGADDDAGLDAGEDTDLDAEDDADSDAEDDTDSDAEDDTDRDAGEDADRDAEDDADSDAREDTDLDAEDVDFFARDAVGRAAVEVLPLLPDAWAGACPDACGRGCVSQATAAPVRATGHSTTPTAPSTPAPA
ncbi:hypothetical protein ACFYZJ_18550 [Streptomyces sp. NPDC001848]|uniref:hypothetical protein n=1 Tax=Streptomyces sp. NPDC001848 TaxID=3364618 RepID=UPI00369AE4BF